MNSTSNTMPAKVRLEPHWFLGVNAMMQATVTDGYVFIRADIVERLVEALRIIAGERQCIDNLMGNTDVARSALTSYQDLINDKH